MKMPTFSFDETIRQHCPGVRLGCLLVHVKVAPSSPDLLHRIRKNLDDIRENKTLDDVHALPSIDAARAVYKMLGKDPSRYRPSAEALLRRVLQGKGLYQVNNVVDSLNLISALTGISIGGYDAAKITGDISCGRGDEAEPYEAIGRGVLNIDGLPVLRDEGGAFGSPTSDSVRTMVTDDCTEFLAVFFDFGASPELEKAMEDLSKLLSDFAEGTMAVQNIIKAG